jgi:hypothetical protein
MFSIQSRILSSAFLCSLFAASCVSYTPVVSNDVMTGESVVVIPNVRVTTVQGAQSTGMAVLTGSSSQLRVRDMRISDSRTTFDLVFESSYGSGLLASSGGNQGCQSQNAQISINQNLFDLIPEGTVQNTGLVSQRTFGQATSGENRQSVKFILPEEAIGMITSAQQVLISYCSIVVSVDPLSLSEIREAY